MGSRGAAGGSRLMSGSTLVRAGARRRGRAHAAVTAPQHKRAAPSAQPRTATVSDALPLRPLDRVRDQRVGLVRLAPVADPHPLLRLQVLVVLEEVPDALDVD